jgi:hypothetical protein
MRYCPALNTREVVTPKLKASHHFYASGRTAADPDVKPRLWILLTSSGTAGTGRQRTTETATLGRPKEKAKPWCPPSLAASGGEDDLFALLLRAGRALT